MQNVVYESAVVGLLRATTQGLSYCRRWNMKAKERANILLMSR